MPGPTIINNVAMGNIVIIDFILTRFGGDNFTNKQVRVNFKLWNGNDETGVEQYGFESIGFVDATLKSGAFVTGPTTFGNPVTQKNIDVRFQRLSDTQCYVEIELYMTLHFFFFFFFKKKNRHRI